MHHGFYFTYFYIVYSDIGCLFNENILVFIKHINYL